MIDYRKLYSKYDKEDLINTCLNLKEYKERLRKEVNKSYMICNEKDKEIERLNKELQDTKEHLGEYLHEQEEENKRLNNIINELEKYIKESCWKDDWGVESIYVKNLLNKLQELKEKNKFNIINKPTFTTSSTSGNRPLPPKQTKGSDE